MEIFGKITGIKYKPIIGEELRRIDYDLFDINTCPSSCLVSFNEDSFAISKWVSPKRTRSYPYERVYNTLKISKKITVIPILKDEGAAGDRDFVQWDTVSLMSLLDVYVIFAYYVNADAKGSKITNQQFDNSFVLNKINDISNYHSSALHWNLDQLKNIHNIIDLAKASYLRIENETGVKLHGFNGVDNFKDRIGLDVELFLKYSRDKAQEAQNREFKTTQPKEILSSQSKAKITIANYLGGYYFFTVDEVKYTELILNLIECKHSSNSQLPSKGDIKDGLIKMILYSNLVETTVNDKTVKCIPVLQLTSSLIELEITSEASKERIEEFFVHNHFRTPLCNFVLNLFEEAKSNNFIVIITGV